MSIIYSVEGYFCEDKLEYVWKSKVKYGNIMLTPNHLLFEGGVKKSLVSKSDVGFNIKIPFSTILRVTKTKFRMIHIVVIETIEGKLFTFTMADDFTMGKKKAIDLYKVLNQVVFEYKKDLALCSNCGKEVENGHKYCIHCGREISEP